MDPADFDIHPGTVTYWALESVAADRPAIEQLDQLKEDLAQIAYPGGSLLDIGWYPEFSRDGAFVVAVVRNGDWDEPVFREECVNLEDLQRIVARAKQVALSVETLGRGGPPRGGH